MKPILKNIILCIFAFFVVVMDSSAAEKIVPKGFSLIPAGKFMRGAEPGVAGISIYVSAFFMKKTEVTKSEWDEVATWAASNGYDITAAGGEGKVANHPVQEVTWYECVKWCNAKSEKEGKTAVYTVSGNTYRTGESTPVINYAANGYRLPTEAEWEKAARGGLNGKRFPWGDTIDHSKANYKSFRVSRYETTWTRGYHPTYNDGTLPYTSPVGSFAANGYGLYDMSGNVFEWCNDWYGTYAGNTDPTGATSGSSRVLRGGSWCFGADDCRVANRNCINATYCRIASYPSGPPHSYVIGFRPVRRSVNMEDFVRNYLAADSIEKSVRNYLAADSIEKILPFVRHQDRVAPLMENYYNHHDFQPAKFKNFSRILSVKLENQPFTYVKALLADGNTRNLLIEELADGSFRVDWESDVCYQPMEWEKYIKKRPPQPIDMRVKITPDTFYADEFKDESRFQCYRITTRDSDQHLFGYTFKTSPTGKAINKLILKSRQHGRGTNDPMILRLRFPEKTNSKNCVWIDALIAPRWTYLTPSQLDTPTEK